MLIIMKPDHTQEDIDRVTSHIKTLGFEPHVLPGEQRVAIGITGNQGPVEPSPFLGMPGVADAIRVSKPYKLASRAFAPKNFQMKVASENGSTVTFGDGHFVVMAGPCSVESEEQTLRIAHAVKERGAHVLRGGAYKPRSSPYAFQGLGIPGLEILKKASLETGLPIISEALDEESLEAVAEYADIIQIGARNMQNFSLLKKIGQLDKPAMLKRGISATIEEWLMAAEYILSQGNKNVLLCERGIRSYDKATRNLLDLSAVPVAQELSHLPIVVDPSHGTGRRDKVAPMAKGAIAVGAQSVIVEVHDRPHEALSDGPQALLPEDFAEMMRDLRKIANALELKMN